MMQTLIKEAENLGCTFEQVTAPWGDECFVVRNADKSRHVSWNVAGWKPSVEAIRLAVAAIKELPTHK